MAEYYLANVVCMPLASTVAVSRMILSGVFERFPELKMLVVHGGGYLPFYFARTDLPIESAPRHDDTFLAHRANTSTSCTSTRWSSITAPWNTWSKSLAPIAF
jgi:predicted TIM-barrel fold metal-dependent hydrolase